ncbi:hypothetical protein [Scytonema sp. UIC 10036]|uniref:hypothetical protein n=1 Tax=Scytonema sp. UIC 10036 TaxID=2304196 RepID=UPI001A9C00E0|nr:hypothetical protein [Scytonema sp. UIC 10036]
MPNVEIVANIQDFVSNFDSVIAAQIMADIDRANNFQKTASEIYFILTSGRLVRASKGRCLWRFPLSYKI